ncbi:SDR family oxidoreductase [Limimaricola pyoseonensis]|uniref:NADP-dependent 3-hydroxy acid dehydrogenase YdfG n=1 Tax=Limimaricola pyoseonensis TaxID=521013 RepID=A0A1G7C524_9RHOB|nr:SDR family oxidoreductase [Limimaricola pyoseonensis]SDE34484.1 NADP-dependent 3-hydroxy acid dehydrogenase YdfG [Limimaricola pyoseonensis]
MKTAIVTGASSGIGRAVAEELLAHGWTVGLIARRAERLEEIAAAHAGAVPLPCDVTAPEAVEAAFAEFDTTAGRLDLLFNNAGIFVPPALPDEIESSDWDASVAVNLTGMFLCARAAFGRMRRQDPQGGRIVNNGSISAQAPRPGALCYTTTKHAITGLTKGLALDGRAHGIACGQIDIGNARTELIDDLVQREVAAGREAPPVMEVAHVARAVRHMAELPPEANVLFQTVMATTMPFVGRG